MDLLEDSVRGAEDFTGLPLPNNHVALLYEDAVDGDGAGTNFETHIAILPEYDVDDGSDEADIGGSTIAHEVAHYYWSGNTSWVDEGAAEFMASIIDGARTGRPIGATFPPCAYARTIAELERLDADVADIEYECAYSLGERLFIDLFRAAAEERFRAGFRDLFLLSAIEDDVDDFAGTSVGIAQVKEIFGSETTPVARWYDGTEPFVLESLDTSPVIPDLPSINGRIDKACVALSEDGLPVATFSDADATDRVFLTLEYSYDVSGGPHVVQLEIAKYYEDGFVFNRGTIELTAEEGYIDGSFWLTVGPSPPDRKAPGRYWIYVYSDEQKVAEVQYEVTP